jgi:hypothetical protein
MSGRKQVAREQNLEWGEEIFCCILFIILNINLFSSSTTPNPTQALPWGCGERGVRG